MFFAINYIFLAFWNIKALVIGGRSGQDGQDGQSGEVLDFFLDSGGDINLISVIPTIVIAVLFFCLGAYLVIQGVREKKAWKIIIGIFITGFLCGLIIWGIIILKNKNENPLTQQITSPPPVDIRRKTTPRQKNKKKLN